ncbi:hypothetical protein [Mycolicibacterium wolinskyi]|uniref:hypothetical protein n=1 Tax=Mycolicibacterium wolinskyi TaxID=59750 RepID=UPI003BA85D49
MTEAKVNPLLDLVRLQVEEECETVLQTVPRSDYTNEETVALAVLLRPIYQRYLAETRAPGRVLQLVRGNE